MSASQSLPQAWQIADLSLSELLKRGKAIKREDCEKTIRLAVLGDCATQHYTECLVAALKCRGLWPEVYQAEYDAIRKELLDDASGMHAFVPEVVVFFNCVQMLEQRFVEHGHAGLIETVLDELQFQWERVLLKHKSIVIQHNFCAPLDFSFGNFARGCPASLGHAVLEINRTLFVSAQRRGNVRIVDTDSQASYHGRRHWLDEGLWNQAKQALSPRFLPPLVKMVSDVILEAQGISTKCVILDLDNTTWGGILGDVGAGGLEIGEIDPMGGIFTRFQGAMKNLTRRGILLAVCSKNSQEAVDEVFKSHPDMTLRPDDLAICVANYEDKVSNILFIQRELNIGLDACVFLDDAPIERDFVRSRLPQIQVPELPEDPAEVLRALANWNLFEASQFSDEDQQRTSLYRANATRKQMLQNAGDYEAYLESLDSVAEIESFNELTLARTHQLLQRSNQFNLTTRRHTEGALREFAIDAQRTLAFTVRLHDRVSNHGIISVLIAEAIADSLVIDSWVMSCRVLSRYVEEVVFGEALRFAQSRGLRKIEGTYVKTAKNSMVAGLLPRFGFQLLETEGDTTRYALDVAETVIRPNLPIRVVQKQRV